MKVSHVPSISGWLAARRFAKSRQADEAMLGWGDPLFDLKSKPVATHSPTRSIQLSRGAAASSLETESPRMAVVDYSKIPPLPETRDELLSNASAMKAIPTSDLKLRVRKRQALVCWRPAHPASSRENALSYLPRMALLRGIFRGWASTRSHSLRNPKRATQSGPPLPGRWD